MFKDRCPLCNTAGKKWNRKPEVWVCPNCSSLFSKFGIVLESEKELVDFWS